MTVITDLELGRLRFEAVVRCGAEGYSDRAPAFALPPPDLTNF